MLAVANIVPVAQALARVAPEIVNGVDVLLLYKREPRMMHGVV